MSKDIIKFYPVDNGDTTLIKLRNNTTILFDCKIRSGEKNSDDYDIFDVKGDLLKTLEKRNNIPYLDMFALTHPDEDHCLGFEKHFYTGSPNDYNDKDKELIIVDELWVTPMVFTNNGVSNDDAKVIRKEARRRKKLYDENDEAKNDRGNRLIIVGYDGEDKLENILHYYPSDIVNEISGVKQDLFSFFIHAPLKADLVTGRAEKDKNTTSIVVQARFRINSDDEAAARLILGGDADHYNWEKILEKTEKHGNEEALKWDLFLAPHHCSWTYFNNVPIEEKEVNKIPQDYSVKIIKDYHLEGGQIIASSKLIKDNDDNPPHNQAKKEYIKNIDSKDDFISLAESPKPSKPEPVIFEVSSDGLNRIDDGESSTEDKLESAAAIGASSAVSGNWCKS
ncbi:MAG: cobyric acid synthase CobQ [Flavobacteriales bacterium]|nr:MAG: cobyric acid synthase CobQ [Flavobacteriales bacterium]